MKKIILFVFVLCFLNVKAENQDKLNISKFLLISSPDNIKTKHYPLVMIAEALNVSKDSASYKLNSVIIENMIEIAPVFKTHYHQFGDKKIEMAKVSKDEFKNMLTQAGADFIVLLEEYELIWKDEPFPALFHNIKYSVYNGEKELVKEGSNFYSTYDLVDEKELKKASRKCSKKIADNILKYSMN